MSILIATPMYGGQCSAAYCASAVNLSAALTEAGIDHDWLFAWNESLIQRARNKMAAAFLASPFRKLLFIDADIRFAPDDVAKLWNMETQVAVAAYPMKRPDAPLSAWVGGELVTGLDDLPNPCPVDYAGTGFMMIDRSVFEAMKSPDIEIRYDFGPAHAFFACPIHGGVEESEDYHFCRRWRDLGGQILLEPTIRLGHVGTWIYGDHDQSSLVRAEAANAA